MSMTIPVQKLHPNSKIPTQGNRSDAGYDLYTSTGKQLNPGKRETFGTGIAVAIPEGYAGIVKPRSGLSHRHGLNVLAGVIDSGFRGEIGVVLHNTDPEEAYVVEPYERIAQLLIVPVQEVGFAEVVSLPDAERGEAGFGSTGTH